MGRIEAARYAGRIDLARMGSRKERVVVSTEVAESDEKKLCEPEAVQDHTGLQKGLG